MRKYFLILSSVFLFAACTDDAGTVYEKECEANATRCVGAQESVCQKDFKWGEATDCTEGEVCDASEQKCKQGGIAPTNAILVSLNAVKNELLPSESTELTLELDNLAEENKTVSLEVIPPEIASVPASVEIAKGKKIAKFNLTASATATPGAVFSVKASLGDKNLSASFSIISKCTEGALRCSEIESGSYNRMKCDANGEWQAFECAEAETCAVINDLVECINISECEQGKSLCTQENGVSQAWVCNSKKSWDKVNCVEPEVCQFVDSVAVCKAADEPACVAGALKCQDDNLAVLVCDEAGAWVVQNKCDETQVCSDKDAKASCVPKDEACEPGLKKCSDDLQYTMLCNKDGKWENGEACGKSKVCEEYNGDFQCLMPVRLSSLSPEAATVIAGASQTIEVFLSSEARKEILANVTATGPCKLITEGPNRPNELIFLVGRISSSFKLTINADAAADSICDVKVSYDGVDLFSSLTVGTTECMPKETKCELGQLVICDAKSRWGTPTLCPRNQTCPASATTCQAILISKVTPLSDAESPIVVENGVANLAEVELNYPVYNPSFTVEIAAPILINGGVSISPANTIEYSGGASKLSFSYTVTSSETSSFPFKITIKNPADASNNHALYGEWNPEVELCKESQTRCLGWKIQTCGADGSWMTPKDCETRGESCVQVSKEAAECQKIISSYIAPKEMVVGKAYPILGKYTPVLTSKNKVTGTSLEPITVKMDPSIVGISTQNTDTVDFSQGSGVRYFAALAKSFPTAETNRIALSDELGNTESLEPIIRLCKQDERRCLAENNRTEQICNARGEWTNSGANRSCANANPICSLYTSECEVHKIQYVHPSVILTTRNVIQAPKFAVYLNGASTAAGNLDVSRTVGLQSSSTRIPIQVGENKKEISVDIGGLELYDKVTYEVKLGDTKEVVEVYLID